MGRKIKIGIEGGFKEAESVFEDYGIEGDGIVATLRCSNETCNADFEGYLRLDDEE